MENQKIIQIGCGEIGLPISKALLKQDIVSKENYFIVVKSKKTKNKIEKKLSCPVFYDIQSIQINRNDVIILAIRPQQADDVLCLLEKKRISDTLTISIMAGYSLKNIKKYLPQAQIVRTMPNLPVINMASMTTYCTSDGISSSNTILLKRILDSFGHHLDVKDEEKLDASTAVTGSGPGFIFYFAKAFFEQCIKFGFTPDESFKMVKNTFRGTALIIESESFEKMLSKVLRPGGTTVAGVNYLDDNKVQEHIQKCIQEAFLRAQEIAQGNL